MSRILGVVSSAGVNVQLDQAAIALIELVSTGVRDE